MGAYLEILKLVWPLALGMVNNALMQFVDRMFLAHESMASLEAVLPASTLAWVFMSFFQSVVGYSGVFVAQYFGAGERGNCERSYRAGLLIALVSGLLMLPMIPLGNMIFSATAKTEVLAALERSYFNVVCLGGGFLFVQMAALSYFTGKGQTRIVFWVNLLGNALNIALDPLLIFGYLGLPRMGIAGAAYATVFSQIVQCVILVGAAVKEQRIDRDVGTIKVRNLAIKILRYGIPAGGYEILNMLSFTIFVFVTGRMGDIEFAASNACFTINYLLFAPMMGLAIGAQTLVGQHLGSGDAEGAELAFKRTLTLGLLFVGVACGVVLAMRGPILGLFAPPDMNGRGEFLALGFTLLCLMSVWMLFDATDVILSGALKGAGDTKFVMIWMTICAFGIWLPSVFVILRRNGTMPMLWSTMVVFVIIICIGSYARWVRGKWKKIKLV